MRGITHDLDPLERIRNIRLLGGKPLHSWGSYPLLDHHPEVLTESFASPVPATVPATAPGGPLLGPMLRVSEAREGVRAATGGHPAQLPYACLQGGGVGGDAGSRGRWGQARNCHSGSTPRKVLPYLPNVPVCRTHGARIGGQLCAHDLAVTAYACAL